MPLYLGVFCSRILGFFFSDIFVFFKLSVCFVCFFLISILWYILTLNIHICCMKNYWKQIPVNISYLWIGKFSPFPFLFFFFLILFIYLWLCWVFVSVRGLSLVVASGGHSSSRCVGLSLSQLLLLRSTGSRCAGSVIVAHGPSSSAACGIFPDQGSNPCSLHWQADSQPLCHQGSPPFLFITLIDCYIFNSFRN